VISSAAESHGSNATHCVNQLQSFEEVSRSLPRKNLTDSGEGGVQVLEEQLGHVRKRVIIQRGLVSLNILPNLRKFVLGGLALPGVSSEERNKVFCLYK